MCGNSVRVRFLSKVRNLDPSVHCLRLRRCINDRIEVSTPAPHELLQDLVPELRTRLLFRLDGMWSAGSCALLGLRSVGDLMIPAAFSFLFVFLA